MSAKPDVLADVRRAMKEIEARPTLEPRRTVHHPNCSAVASGKLVDCNCGGWAFTS